MPKLFPNASQTIVLYRGSPKDDDPYETLEYDQRTRTWKDSADVIYKAGAIADVIAEWSGEQS